jgi:hypothetical protein
LQLLLVVDQEIRCVDGNQEYKIVPYSESYFECNAKNFSYSSIVEEAGTVIGGALLKSHMTTAPPDMSPFFLRQYVKGHASDVFEAYPQLLTEMALRLPYQVQKQADSATAIPLTFQQVICF